MSPLPGKNSLSRSKGNSVFILTRNLGFHVPSSSWNKETAASPPKNHLSLVSTNSAFLLSAETRLRLCVANESRIRVAPSSRTQTRMKRIHVHESDEPEFVGWALERPSSQTADELFQSEVRYLKNTGLHNLPSSASTRKITAFTFRIFTSRWLFFR